ncbi:hypothetical protein HYX12_01120 [Candidatus Woesearchaeota archaeon]|nr:hypothetical protein [Candidatus Woesearchaeota archaeon]
MPKNPQNPLITLGILGLGTKLAPTVSGNAVDLSAADRLVKGDRLILQQIYHSDRWSSANDGVQTGVTEAMSVVNASYDIYEHASPEQRQAWVRQCIEGNYGADPAVREQLARAVVGLRGLQQAVRERDQKIQDLESTVADLANGRNVTAPSRPSSHTVVYDDGRGYIITMGTAQQEIAALQGKVQGKTIKVTQLEISLAEAERKLRSCRIGYERTELELSVEKRAKASADARAKNKYEGRIGELEASIHRKEEERRELVRVTNTEIQKLEKQVSELRAAGREQAIVLQGINERYTAERTAAEHLVRGLTRKLEETSRNYQTASKRLTDLEKDSRPITTKILEAVPKLRDSGQYDEALTRCRIVLEADPSNPHANYFAGTTYERMGDVVNAGTHYRRVLEVGKHSSAEAGLKRVRTPLEEQLQTARTRKEHETVVEIAQRLMTIDPSNTHTHYYCATSYEALGRLPEALEQYQLAGKGSSASAGIERVTAALGKKP